MSEASGRSLVTKLRAFADTLDDEERRLFAVLIGPDVERAVGDPGLEAFATGASEYDRLVRGLVDLARGDHPPGGAATEGD